MSSFFVGPETINATVTLLLMADGPRSTMLLGARAPQTQGSS